MEALLGGGARPAPAPFDDRPGPLQPSQTRPVSPSPPLRAWMPAELFDHRPFGKGPRSLTSASWTARLARGGRSSWWRWRATCACSHGCVWSMPGPAGCSTSIPSLLPELSGARTRTRGPSPPRGSEAGCTVHLGQLRAWTRARGCWPRPRYAGLCKTTHPKRLAARSAGGGTPPLSAGAGGLRPTPAVSENERLDQRLAGMIAAVIAATIRAWWPRRPPRRRRRRRPRRAGRRRERPPATAPPMAPVEARSVVVVPQAARPSIRASGRES